MGAPPSAGIARRAPTAPVVRPVPSADVPARLGFRMPAEFEPHARLWMVWPGAVTRSWADPAILATVRDLACAARRFETVRVVVAPAYRDEAMASLGSAFEFLEAPVDDIWVRDSGPTFLVRADGDVAATTWNFNGWGDKFDGYDSDRALAARVAAARAATRAASARSES